jgi:hypothetical protein
MSPQIEVEGELLAAQLAFEWFLASVHELMPLELRVVQESFTATFNGTDVLSLAMSHKMLP